MNTGSGDDGLLERQPAQRDVEADAGLCAQEQHTMRQSKLRGVLNARFKMAQENFDKVCLAAEAGEQREIDINRFARFAPTLQRQPADNAEAPSLRLADGLKFDGRSDDFSHGARLS